MTAPGFAIAKPAPTKQQKQRYAVDFLMLIITQSAGNCLISVPSSPGYKSFAL